jgi:mannose-6-phosphate isomerase
MILLARYRGRFWWRQANAVEFGAASESTLFKNVVDSRVPRRKIAATFGSSSCGPVNLGGLAQLVRAGVSYAPGPGFESLIRHDRNKNTEWVTDMRKVDKPWGHELIWAVTDRYVGKVLHIKKGEQLSLQYHRVKDETVMVWSGRMRFVHYGEGEPEQQTDLGPGEAFHVTPGLRHRMIALEDCDVFEVSTTELDDVVRLQDVYGRQGTSEA